MSSVEEFNDSLAAESDVLFEDWLSAAQWHGVVVAGVLAAQRIRPPARLLDCTCGIGTQALPLAARGSASIRDYDTLSVERSAGVPITLYGEPGARYGSEQSWRWSSDAEHVTSRCSP